MIVYANSIYKYQRTVIFINPGCTVSFICYCPALFFVVSVQIPRSTLIYCVNDKAINGKYHFYSIINVIPASNQFSYTAVNSIFHFEVIPVTSLVSVAVKACFPIHEFRIVNSENFCSVNNTGYFAIICCNFNTIRCIDFVFGFIADYFSPCTVHKFENSTFQTINIIVPDKQVVILTILIIECNSDFIVIR